MMNLRVCVVLLASLYFCIAQYDEEYEEQDISFNGNSLDYSEDYRDKRQCLGKWARCQYDSGPSCCNGYCHQDIDASYGNCRKNV
ncbi:Antimicrobial peptide 2 [Orchesella cincta]|uniref:Antimicrobial peptide 2 n=1 Tax=Orchesella cincta TaxID=48709 RepID=A0A1D2NAF4_ORCCI|nr:Antimicrobial peptide 2 [Orchesella cincta]